MNVYWYDKEINKNDFKNKSILLLGEFEFFHIGHNKLLSRAQEIKKENEQIGIFIINNPNKKYIQTLEDRIHNLGLLNFDFVVVANFDFEFKNTKGDEFINNLIKKFNVKTFVAGEDFRFGYERKFSANDIENISNNVSIEIIEIEKENNRKISSSIIKEMYEYGELNALNKLLINPINVCAQIEKNNLLIWNKELIKPHFGIYYAKVKVEEYLYSGLIHFSIDGLIYFKLINIDNDTHIFNQKTNVFLLNIERIIISKRIDHISNQDVENAKLFFSLPIDKIE